VKILDKRQIIREKKVQYVSREKEVLSAINHPFFVKLFFTFQDTDNLCILLVLPASASGEKRVGLGKRGWGWIRKGGAGIERVGLRKRER